MANFTLYYQGRDDTLAPQWKWPVALMILCGIVSLSSYLKRAIRYRNRLPLPPGPRGIPILGNALQLAKGAKTGSWLMYARWAKEYGEPDGFPEICLMFRAHSLRFGLR